MTTTTPRWQVTLPASTLATLRVTGNREPTLGGWQIRLGESGDVWAYISADDARQIAAAFAAASATIDELDETRLAHELAAQASGRRGRPRRPRHHQRAVDRPMTRTITLDVVVLRGDAGRRLEELTEEFAHRVVETYGQGNASVTVIGDEES